MIASFIKCYSALKDSDTCLQTSDTSTWDGYDCSGSLWYCELWDKDMRRCCPETCKNSEPFTEIKCNQSNEKGTCLYPFFSLPDECYQGRKLIKRSGTKGAQKIS